MSDNDEAARSARADGSINAVADSLLQRVEPIGEADRRSGSTEESDAPNGAEVREARRDQTLREKPSVEEEDFDVDNAREEDPRNSTDNEEDGEDVDAEDDLNFDDDSDEDSPAYEDGDEDFDTPAETAVSDDTLIKVTVDGEEVETTLGELKKRYAGEGAIEKRLQEATESRKKVLEQLHTNREQLEQVISAVGGLVFTPTVERPDPALAQQNPTQYLIQKDLYEQDQASINERRNAIAQVFTEIENRRQKTIGEIKEVEAQRLMLA
jgi:hypothetical protein